MSEHIVSRPELTVEYLRSILNYDPTTGIFTRKVRTSNSAKVGEVTGSQKNHGYLRISVLDRNYQAHRLAWLYVHGEWPKSQIDHVNRNRSDNRIANLRDVTNKQNQQNRSNSRRNTSGHTGVHWLKRERKWQAQLRHNYRNVNLGYFDTLEEAVAARRAGELKWWADTQVADTSPVC